MHGIDFRQMRRQERKNARARSDQIDSKNRHIVHKKQATNADAIHTTISDDVKPFETLLPKLTETHRVHPPQNRIDSIYYTKSFLKGETCKEILDWLHTLPDYVCRSKLSERDESKECNGKWTTLHHARRKGILIMCTPFSILFHHLHLSTYL